MSQNLKISILTNSRLSALARACNIALHKHNLNIDASIFLARTCEDLVLEKRYIRKIHLLPQKPSQKDYDKVSNDSDFKKSSLCMLFYTRFVPETIFRSKPTVNFHPSLLPEHPGLRGFEDAVASHQLALTAHQVSENIDGGANLLQYQILPFPVDRTLAELKRDVSKLCSSVIVELMLRLKADMLCQPRHRVFSSSEDALSFVSGSFSE